MVYIFVGRQLIYIHLIKLIWCLSCLEQLCLNTSHGETCCICCWKKVVLNIDILLRYYCVHAAWRNLSLYC